jgi:hypothetical protein
MHIDALVLIPSTGFKENFWRKTTDYTDDTNDGSRFWSAALLRRFSLSSI